MDSNYQDFIFYRSVFSSSYKVGTEFRVIAKTCSRANCALLLKLAISSVTSLSSIVKSQTVWPLYPSSYQQSDVLLSIQFILNSCFGGAGEDSTARCPQNNGTNQEYLTVPGAHLKTIFIGHFYQIININPLYSPNT